ncbi:MAG: DUF3034 family protein [Burkholderiaceae bacterium]|nr:DUF3034 family protein [Burkholderiaceae bacterium]
MRCVRSFVPRLALLLAMSLAHALSGAQGSIPEPTEPTNQPQAPPATVSQPTLPPPVSGHQGKLLLASGVSSIDGTAGGGLTPWAMTGSYATGDSFGASAYLTRAVVQDYALTGYGAAVAWGDRVEVSIGRQDFHTGQSIAPLGFPGLRLKQTIVGLKVRLAGDAILDSDRLMPQIAVGIQYKDLDAANFAPVLRSLGARTQGTDFYVSATKLFLAQSVLLNGTLRATRANQNGLLGFGSSRQDDYRLQAEMSAALLLRKDVALGIEYRCKPDNLNGVAFGRGLREDDWKDAFIAWTPAKWVSLTLAYVDLGHIVPALTPKRQTGTYVSAQFSY